MTNVYHIVKGKTVYRGIFRCKIPTPCDLWEIKVRIRQGKEQIQKNSVNTQTILKLRI